MLQTAPVDRLGDIPTWIAGIGTLLAVAVALWIALRDGRRRDREVRRRQAEHMTAWLDRDRSTNDGNGHPLKYVVIRNDSGQLAYRVIASLYPERGTVPRDFRERGLPGATVYSYRLFFGELPPGTTERTIAAPARDAAPMGG